MEECLKKVPNFQVEGRKDLGHQERDGQAGTGDCPATDRKAMLSQLRNRLTVTWR
jgi:hypothetical protein